jgi:hypothetical protein
MSQLHPCTPNKIGQGALHSSLQQPLALQFKYSPIQLPLIFPPIQVPPTNQIGEYQHSKEASRNWRSTMFLIVISIFDMLLSSKAPLDHLKHLPTRSRPSSQLQGRQLEPTVTHLVLELAGYAEPFPLNIQRCKG